MFNLLRKIKTALSTPSHASQSGWAYEMIHQVGS